MSTDPLGPFTADGPNLYAYVSANPLRFVDPLGLQGSLPIKNLPYPPPTPPGCVSIGTGMYLCKPDPTPRLCAPKPRKCTPYFDKWMYWACLMIRIPSPSTFYWSPGGTKGGILMTTAGCAAMAMVCAEGGAPPQNGDDPYWPLVPNDNKKIRPPQWGGRR